jgi:hypothetical protein
MNWVKVENNIHFLTALTVSQLVLQHDKLQGIICQSAQRFPQKDCIEHLLYIRYNKIVPTVSHTLFSHQHKFVMLT